MLPTISFIRVFIAMGTRRIFGTPHRAASTRAAAETIADATSPIPGSKPMIGSKPKRRLVPGTRRKSSIMIASHRKSGSREALVRRLCDRSSGGRISHSGSFDSRSLIFDATPHPQFSIGSRQSKSQKIFAGNIFQRFSVRKVLFAGIRFPHGRKTNRCNRETYRSMGEERALDVAL